MHWRFLSKNNSGVLPAREGDIWCHDFLCYSVQNLVHTMASGDYFPMITAVYGTSVWRSAGMNQTAPGAKAWSNCSHYYCWKYPIVTCEQGKSGISRLLYLQAAWCKLMFLLSCAWGLLGRILWIGSKKSKHSTCIWKPEFNLFLLLFVSCQFTLY